MPLLGTDYWSVLINLAFPSKKAGVGDRSVNEISDYTPSKVAGMVCSADCRKIVRMRPRGRFAEGNNAYRDAESTVVCTVATVFRHVKGTHEERLRADEVARITPARCSAEDRGMNTSWAGGAPRKHAD